MGIDVRILAISGSLRKESSNTAVLLAAGRLAPSDWEVVFYEGLAQLPHFNADMDTDDPPAQAVALREQVGSCDGIILCSPEYARGVSGALKNALDWLVGSLEFPGKPVALINASQRATSADAHLRLTLTTMSARLVEAASNMLPLLGRNLDADGIASDKVLSKQLRAALDCFAHAISADR
jgi:chromate reductase